MADATIEGARLKALREAAKLTQPELAERSGVSQPHISRLEDGMRTNVKLSTVNKLATALAVSVFDLIADIHPTGKGVRITHEDVREAVTRALGGQSMLSEQAIDRIVTEIMRQEIKKASERGAARDDQGHSPLPR